MGAQISILQRKLLICMESELADIASHAAKRPWADFSRLHQS